MSILSPSAITLIVLALSCILFVSGRIRSDIVALGSLLLLLLTGVLTPAEALSGFSSTVVIMMVGLFVVGAGIFRTGLAKMISGKIMKVGGSNENVLFLLVMLVTSAIGAFVSNTGTVAVMMPIVMSMASASGISARRYLMPMAFAGSMGLFTLISTPPNLVIQDAIVAEGLEPLGFFSFAPVGAVAVLVGVGVLFFLSRLLVVRDGDRPQGGKRKGKSPAEIVKEYNLAHQSFKVLIPEDSALVGRTLHQLRIGSEYDLSVGRIVHPPQRKFSRVTTEEVAGPESVIRAGDTLIMYGSEENAMRFVKENALGFDRIDLKTEATTAETGYAELYIIPGSHLINHTIADSKFREHYGVNVLGIKRSGEYSLDDIKDVKLHSGDALLIQGTWKNVTALEDFTDDLVLVGQPGRRMAKVTLDAKAPLAAVIMLAMIVVMVLDVIPSVAAVMVAAVLMVATGCLRNMEEAYSSINWSSVVLIASMIPMSVAFDKTGITTAISGFLLEGFGDVGPRGLLAIIYFATSLVTMFLSNTATAVLFTPIAMSAAVTMGVSPYPFLFAVAVSASMCFASPFSTPPNALVMSAGEYKFADYVKVGLPLQIIMGVVMVLVLPLIFPF